MLNFNPKPKHDDHDDDVNDDCTDTDCHNYYYSDGLTDTYKKRKKKLVSA